MKPVRYFVHASEFTQEVYDKLTAMAGELTYSFERLDQKLQEGYAKNLNNKKRLNSDYALLYFHTVSPVLDFCSCGHIEHYIETYDWINLGASGHSAAEHLFIRHLEE